MFDKIKNVSDIVSEIAVFVDLKKKGKNYWAVCPFHDDTSPSMSVSPEKQMFKCFVCQVGGNVINFVAEFEKISFIQAAKKLADKNGIDFKTKEDAKKNYSEHHQKILNVLSDAMMFFQHSLSTKEGEKAFNYLQKRGMKPSDLDQFSIGYAPKQGLFKFLEKKGHDASTIINASLVSDNLIDFFKNRIIFGIKNNYGDIVGFSGRTLEEDEKPKYINSAETPLFNKRNILYNYAIAENFIAKSREVIITEGFMDVVALHKAGIKNVVAIMGTSLSTKHTKILKNKKIILMLDADRAGISATIKSIKTLLNINLDIYVIENNTGLDPDEYLKSKGQAELQKLIQNRKHALEFIFDKHIINFGKNDPEKVETFIKSFSKYFKKYNDTFKDFYINKMSKTLGIEKQTISKLIKNFSNRKDDYSSPSTPTEELIESVKETNKWENTLLSAMISNPELIKIFKMQRVNFIDPIMSMSAKFIVERYNGKKPSLWTETIEKKIKFLIEYSKDKPILQANEFQDIINRINDDLPKKVINKLQNKLNDSTISEVEKLSILEQIRKQQSEREK